MAKKEKDMLADVPGDRMGEAAEVIADIKEGLENLAKVMCPCPGVRAY
jgi:hypothetical protein